MEIRTGAGQRIDEVVSKAEGVLADLWDRWQDEAGLEDLRDYAKALAAVFPPDVEVLRVVGHPFGPVVKCRGRRFRIIVTARQIRWQSIRGS